jgi:hypothetical protein
MIRRLCKKKRKQKSKIDGNSQPAPELNNRIFPIFYWQLTFSIKNSPASFFCSKILEKPKINKFESVCIRNVTHTAV